MRRLSPALLLLIFFAALMALAGVYVIKRGLTPAPAVAPPQVAPAKTYKVPVAAIDLPAGRVVRNEDFFLLDYDEAQSKKLKWPWLTSGTQIIGRTLQVPLRKLSSFHPDSFYPVGTGPVLAERLDPGLRAVTISLKSEDSLPAQTLPGSLVDVIFRTVPAKEDSIPETTQLLLQNVQILALGTNDTPGTQGGIDPKKQTQAVTLAVTSDEATRLKVVRDHGDFALVLRKPEDKSAGMMQPLDLRQVLNLPAPPPPDFVAEIYRGGRRQTLKFARGNVKQEDFGGSPVQRPSPSVEPQPAPQDTPPERMPAPNPGDERMPPDANPLRNTDGGSPGVPDASNVINPVSALLRQPQVAAAQPVAVLRLSQSH